MSQIHMIFTVNNSILRHDTDKKKRNSKINKTLKNETRVKQAIQTLNQHSYLVFSSGNLISIDAKVLDS